MSTPRLDMRKTREILRLKWERGLTHRQIGRSLGVSAGVIELDKHYYSVPYQLLKEVVEVRATKALVEVLHRGKRVASHQRGRPLAGHTTNPEHMPVTHRAHMEWPSSILIEWGAKTRTPISPALMSVWR